MSDATLVVYSVANLALAAVWIALIVAALYFGIQLARKFLGTKSRI